MVPDGQHRCRLGHVGMKLLNKLSKHKYVKGLEKDKFEKDKPCNSCQAGKQVGAAHRPKNLITTTTPFELIHIDLFGPTTYKSLGGNKYGLVIVDDYSRYTWVFFLKDKTQVTRSSSILL